jgi:hypothetical protein
MLLKNLNWLLPFKSFAWYGIVFLALSLSSCHSQKQQDSTPSDITYLSINPSKLPPLAKLTDVVESVRLIPLETNSQCYINAIVRTFVGKEYILVMSPGTMQYLYLFNIDGAFIRKIGRPGKGPTEYTDIRDISVNEERKEVYLSTDLHGEMITYSFDGNFLERIQGLDAAQESKTYLDFEVKVFNINSLDTLSFIPINPVTRPISASLTGSLHSGYFYSATCKDTIWRFEKDTLKPALILDLGSGEMNPKDYLKAKWSQQGLPPGKLIPQGFVFYCSGYYNFFLDREIRNREYTTFHVLVNESSNESWHFTYEPECDNILFSEAIFFQSAAISGELTTVVNAYELIDALPKILDNVDFEYSTELIEQIKQLNYDDNPCLVLYSLK